ncbi:steroid receptor RNA activator 1-like [Patiria miniata]|uniref:SRA1/Sec31 domain-containing protein n=1 Tax=Patiria miniata TaxID=46514 RepID=A0A913ZUN5_PATMI|nr:steroid receptor RNA activator 1-like [Patiria miniata]
MAATRPGNPERGWNDPPMFMYSKDGQKAQSSPRKNPLTQRVGMPQSHASSNIQKTGDVKPGLPQIFTPKAPPVNTVAPVQTFSTPPTVQSKTSPARSVEVKVQGEGQSGLPDDILDTTLAKLRDVLKLCEEKLKARVAEDIKKKLEVLNAAWSADKLCAEVQQRMAKLSTALAGRDYDRAHDVHLSLMVDYVSEVSQWMVGIKRLIMEARTVLPPPTPALETEDIQAYEQQTDNSAEADKAGTGPSEEASAANSEDNQEIPSGGEVSQAETGQSAKEEQHIEQASSQDDKPILDESNNLPSDPDSRLEINDADDERDAAGDNGRQASLDETGEQLGRLSTDLAQTVESKVTNAVCADSGE